MSAHPEDQAVRAPEELFDEHRPEPLVNRRTWLGRAAAVVGVTIAETMLSPVRAEEPAASADPTKVPGSPPSRYGHRSEFETSERVPRSWWSTLTPLQDLQGIVTPASLHFERHHNGIPSIHPGRHRLLVHGLVERPLIFTVEELKRFPSVSRLLFIECSGNSAPEWRASAGQTAQQTHGLTSTNEWTGVRLSTILKEVGAKPDGTWLLAEGSDAAAMTRSLPSPTSWTTRSSVTRKTARRSGRNRVTRSGW